MPTREPAHRGSLQVPPVHVEDREASRLAQSQPHQLHRRASAESSCSWPTDPFLSLTGYYRLRQKE